MGVYTQTNGASMPVSTGGKGTSMSLPPAWARTPTYEPGTGPVYGGPNSGAPAAGGAPPPGFQAPAGSMPASTGGKGTNQVVGNMGGGMQPPAPSYDFEGDAYAAQTRVGPGVSPTQINKPMTGFNGDTSIATGGVQVAQPPQGMPMGPAIQPPQQGFGDDTSAPPDTPERRALWARIQAQPQQGPDRLDTDAERAQVQASMNQPLRASAGGKGTNQAVGGMRGYTPPPPNYRNQAPVYGGPNSGAPGQSGMAPRYAYQQQPAWMSALQSIFQPRQQQSFRYQAPTYAQMERRANPGGWQAPPPVWQPPPPPAAPPPPVAAPAPPPPSPWDNYNPGMDASRTTMQRGGAAKPTEAQKHAGNYKKDHITFQGLPIAIETPKGEAREGRDANGKSWRCVMPADYGYIKRTEGADGDHVDAYVGPDRDSKMVFLINQNDHQTGKFDEHKVMLGYSSERAAVADYVKAFSDDKGADRIRSVEPMSLDGFKQWLKLGKTKTPAKARSIVEHALAVVRSKK